MTRCNEYANQNIGLTHPLQQRHFWKMQGTLSHPHPGPHSKASSFPFFIGIQGNSFLYKLNVVFSKILVITPLLPWRAASTVSSFLHAMYFPSDAIISRRLDKSYCLPIWIKCHHSWFKKHYDIVNISTKTTFGMVMQRSRNYFNQLKPYVWALPKFEAELRSYAWSCYTYFFSKPFWLNGSIWFTSFV